MHGPTPYLVGGLIMALGMAGLLFGSAAVFRNPGSAEAEFVFAFRANGEWVGGGIAPTVDPANDPRPVHMRAVLPVERTRAPVTVRVEVDGLARELTVQPKGLQSDGTSAGEMRMPLTAGVHRITVRLATSPDPAVPARTWTAELEARTGRLAVLSYDPAHGFEFEP